MEEIDIENLDFDEYNREVYSENHSKLDNSHLIDAQKRYKNMIDKFVEKFNKDRKEENESGDEKRERIKKRKY